VRQARRHAGGEEFRAKESLYRKVGVADKKENDKNIENSLRNGFSTPAQFKMRHEAYGHARMLSVGGSNGSGSGREKGAVSLEQVDAKIGTFSKDIVRLAQLRAVFAKYRGQYDPAVVHVTAPLPGNRSSAPSGYTSAMAQMLTDKFGGQIIFHGKDGKPPYGYTVIDHSRKMVYKGKDLIPLAEFIAPSENTPEISAKADRAETKADRTGQNEKEQKTPSEETATYTDHVRGTSEQWIPNIQIDISDDIDDEAIHGRNRRRKRKARTNTR